MDLNMYWLDHITTQKGNVSKNTLKHNNLTVYPQWNMPQGSSSQVVAALTPENIQQCLKTVLIITRGESSYWHLVNRGRKCTKHSTMHRMAPNRKKLSGPNVNTDLIEKPCLGRGSANIFLEGQTKYFRLGSHAITLASTQLCHCSEKAAMDNTETNGHGHVPIKLHWQNRAAGSFSSHSLWTPTLA